MNSKWSWQVGERAHGEEVEISQREVLTAVLIKENSNGHRQGHLEDVLKRCLMMCLHRKTDLILETLCVKYKEGST